MSGNDPDEVLGALRAEVAAVVAARQAELVRVTRSAEVDGRDDEHDPDGATVAFEYALAEGVLRAAETQLAAVDDAIARLRAGVYGLCRDCGAPIAPARLAAQPAAATCFACGAGVRGGIRRRR